MREIKKHHRKLLAILILSAVLGLGVFAQISSAAASPQLGISGDKFTIDGQEKFLLGASYFDARNWKEGDFQKFQENGFNMIRIWLDWPEGYDFTLDWRYFDSYFDAGGNILYEQDLINLVRAAGNYGIIVDVTILQGRSFGGSLVLREAAVRNAVRALKDEPNVLFDVMNEHNNISLNEISIADAGRLIAAGREEDPGAIFTVSGIDSYYSTTYPNFTLKTVSVANDINTGGVDLLSPHLPRGCDWGVDAGNRVSAIKSYAASIGKNIPVYIQEENRRKWKTMNCSVFRTHGGDFPSRTGQENDSDSNYNSDFPYKPDFLTSAKRSKDTGDAAWIFHTQAGFDMRTDDFFARLDPIEQEIVRDLRYVVYSNSGTIELVDPLKELSAGSVTGGEFIVGGGWQAKARADRIVYELPEPIVGSGYAEVEITNFNPKMQCGVNKSDFFALYDGAHGSTNMAGMNEFSTRAMWRTGLNYTKNNAIRVKGSPGIYDGAEKDLAFVPDQSATYKFRIEWDENDIWWSLDGVEKFRQAFGSLAQYSIKYIFLGRDGTSGSDYGTCPGPIYKNLRVYSAGLMQIYSNTDINSDGSVNILDVQLCVNVILETETDPAIIARAKAVTEDLTVCDVLDLQKIVNEILAQ